MCGLIAWVGEMPTDLDDLCLLNGGRGPHQHGWAIMDDFITVKKNMGPIKPINYGNFVVGHSRLATSGSYSGSLPDINEAQPYVHNNFVIAHNGILFTEENKQYANSVDTLMLFEVEDPHDFVAYVAETEGTRHALITATRDSMIVGSYGQPLFIREESNTLTVASVPSDGDWQPIRHQIVFQGVGK